MPTLHYTPNGALHHLLTGIKALITKSYEASCTWHSLHAWTRMNPCAAERVELQPMLDKLAADRYIEVTTIDANGLSAGDYTNTRIKLLGSGLLNLSALNIQRSTPKPQGTVAGRKVALTGQQSPLDRKPVQRDGADQFRGITSRTGDTHRQYDAGQGLGAAL